MAAAKKRFLPRALAARANGRGQGPQFERGCRLAAQRDGELQAGGKCAASGAGPDMAFELGPGFPIQFLVEVVGDLRQYLLASHKEKPQTTVASTGAFNTISMAGAFNSVLWIRHAFTARRTPAWCCASNSGVDTSI